MFDKRISVHFTLPTATLKALDDFLVKKYEIPKGATRPTWNYRSREVEKAVLAWLQKHK